MDSKVLRIGLIGAGRIGKLHGSNIQASVPGARVVRLAEPLLNGGHEAWAAQTGISKATKDPADIMNDKDIDAVFICSPTYTHADFIVQAARKGKHIFCEKPIHTDIQKIKEALAEVDKAGVKLQIGFVRRFDHNHKKVHDTVASGMLGKPHIVKITSRDPEGPPLDYIAGSGGIFMDMTIHDFDMARYLAGSEITEVAAYGAVNIDPAYKKYGDVDTAAVMLKFENGVIGLIDNSRAARYGYDQRTEVHCDKGCVQVANDLNDTSMISTAGGVVCEKPTWFFLERYNNAFIAEAAAFVDAVNNNKNPPVDGKDGLMSVYAAMAADKSLKENRLVKLSELVS
ncbi:MAG: inositol 2-dehydrogenase [Spirochaetaceae bacterium]|jgi:myo-inositol 2-dehydrogenase/D-chiro-inositol 1-dehydrogenase|nr:inositol 2-dehydrogenase [Spirochaetaceae bacterium]